MKSPIKTIRALASICLSVLMLGSCVKELEHPLENESGEKTVRFSLRVPGINNPATRALGADQEDELNNVTVLVFNPSTDNLYKHETPTGTIGGTGVRRTFDVTLPVGTYDLMIIANANDSIAKRYPKGIARGTSKDDILKNLVLVKQEALTVTGDRAGDKWNADPADAKKRYLIPMWGQLTNAVIKDVPANLQDLGTVSMYRMVAKIDVKIPRKDKNGTTLITKENFELTEVTFHNYNTNGRIIPAYGNGLGWENAAGGKATAPTLADNVHFIGGADNFQRFTKFEDLTSSDEEKVNPLGVNTELQNTIYTFEADKGSNYENKPCVIIGGKFNQSAATTYYRVDLIDGSTKVNLDLLRNHRYIIYVKKISGPGYESIKEAYKTAPINIEVEIIPWDENNYLEAEWSGNQWIKFTTKEVHFTQFAEPNNQVVTIRTSLPELKFDNFMNATQGQNDLGTWVESPGGTWTNEHFTVVITKNTISSYTEYTLTFSAKPTTSVATDPRRKTTFKVKGLNMEADFTITQDGHMEYKLITDPDELTPIVLDGAAQRFRIQVTSTHDYKVKPDVGSPMFKGVYLKNGDLAPDVIDKSVTEIFIEVTKHTDIAARVGSFIIKHVDEASEVVAKTFNVLQVTPSITAVLATGGNAIEVPMGGGSEIIKVSSNIAQWEPVLSLDGELITDIQEIKKYLGMTAGSFNTDVTFTIPAIPTGATQDRTFFVYFKDKNSSTKSNTIQITQKYKIPGSGSGGTIPTGSVRAEEFILSVNAKGQLNLDGAYADGTQNWIVYFKWGSTIALSAGTTDYVSSGEFDKKYIAWTPDGFDYNAFSTVIDGESDVMAKYNKILTPARPRIIMPANTPENLAKGLGDPCRLAIKEGYNIGDFKTPTSYVTGKWFEDIGPWVKNVRGAPGGAWSSDKAQFYPATGIWGMVGLFSLHRTMFMYWATNDTEGAILFHHSDSNYLSVTVYANSESLPASSIRCVLAE